MEPTRDSLTCGIGKILAEIYRRSPPMLSRCADQTEAGSAVPHGINLQLETIAKLAEFAE
jgi:hypothetical protein